MGRSGTVGSVHQILLIRKGHREHLARVGKMLCCGTNAYQSCTLNCGFLAVLLYLRLGIGSMESEGLHLGFYTLHIFKFMYMYVLDSLIIIMLYTVHCRRTCSVEF